MNAFPFSPWPDRCLFRPPADSARGPVESSRLPDRRNARWVGVALGLEGRQAPSGPVPSGPSGLSHTAGPRLAIATPARTATIYTVPAARPIPIGLAPVGVAAVLSDDGSSDFSAPRRPGERQPATTPDICGEAPVDRPDRSGQCTGQPAEQGDIRGPALLRMAPLGHRIARQVGWAFSRLQYLAGATAVVLLVVAAAQQPVSKFDIVPTPERRLDVCLDGCTSGPVNPDLTYEVEP